MSMIAKIPEVRIKKALFLEGEESFKDAEDELVKAGKPNQAIDMYIHQQAWDDALRIAEHYSSGDIPDILSQQNIWAQTNTDVAKDVALAERFETATAAVTRSWSWSAFGPMVDYRACVRGAPPEVRVRMFMFVFLCMFLACRCPLCSYPCSCSCSCCVYVLVMPVLVSRARSFSCCVRVTSRVRLCVTVFLSCFIGMSIHRPQAPGAAQRSAGPILWENCAAHGC